MADILVLEASAARHRGSSPLLGTTTIVMKKFILLPPLLSLVACTTTRTNIDDHSFHYSGPPPVNKVEHHTHIHKTYRQSTIQESDQDYLNDHPVTKSVPTSHYTPPPTPAPSPYWYFQPQPVQRVAYTPPPPRLQPYVTSYPVVRPSAPIGTFSYARAGRNSSFAIRGGF